MKPKKPPKLYAVFDPAGKLVEDRREWKGAGRAFLAKGWAWYFAGFGGDMATKRAKRQGYTCEEVEIVRVQR